MNGKLIAITITFQGKVNNILLKSWKVLNDELKIKYISSRSPKPHITLKSGYIKNISQIKKIFRTNKIKKFKIKSLGLGIFANNDPLLYIRWEQNKKLINLYNLINKITKNSFKNISDNTKLSNWVPKTTLAYKDFNYQKIESIIEKLKFVNKIFETEIDKIEIMSVDKEGEKIVSTHKLIS